MKAWLSMLGIAYPRIHDLEALLALLADQGCDTAPYLDLIDLNDFAVQFRYDAFDDNGSDMDRNDTIVRVKQLMASVEKLVPGKA